MFDTCYNENKWFLKRTQEILTETIFFLLRRKRNKAFDGQVALVGLGESSFHVSFFSPFDELACCV